jgi:hypothetical protein
MKQPPPDPTPLVRPTYAEAKTEYLSNGRVLKILRHKQDYLLALYPDLAALDALPALSPSIPS